MVRVHIWVSGLVQGVFFRHTTKENARKLNLKGWVRNLADGRVEIIAEGEKENLENLLKWCHIGPYNSRVDHVQAEWETFKDEFSGFYITD